MAMKSLSIADKPTLDEVNGKCDQILNKVQSGGGSGGSFDLGNVTVLILDFVNDEIYCAKGAIDEARRRATT